MTIRQIQGYVYHCDGDNCQTEHTQENAEGHYQNSCPPGWANITFKDEHRHCGFLLCGPCSNAVVPTLPALPEIPTPVTPAEEL